MVSADLLMKRLLTHCRRYAFPLGAFELLFEESRKNALVIRDDAGVEEDFMTTTDGVRVARSAVRLAKARGRDADVGKAAQALASEPRMSPSDPVVVAQIVKQFTPASHMMPLSDCSVDLSSVGWTVGKVCVEGLEGDSAIDALAWSADHLPRKRAQDHCGWKYEHYKCLQLAVLEGLVVAYMRADVPEVAKEFIAGSRGYIVSKSSGEARVVCAVLTLRRVAERCAMVQDREAFGRLLALAGHYGMCIDGGVEFVFHANLLAVLAVLDELDAPERCVITDPSVCSSSDSQPVSAQTDFANAFPSIHQAKILESLEAHAVFHPLVASARMTYEVKPSCFFVEDGVLIRSQLILDGCHQGAPLAGLHFSVGTMPLAVGLQEVMASRNGVCHWIMDDCSFAGEASAVLDGFRYLEHHCPDYGLVLKPAKLKLWAPLMPPDVSDRPASLIALGAHGFEIRRDGLKRVLGAPLTFRPALAREWVEDRVALAASLMDRIPLLDDPQVELSLLLFCGSTKLSFLTRMLPLSFLHPSLCRNDASMRRCLEESLKCQLSGDRLSCQVVTLGLELRILSWWPLLQSCLLRSMWPYCCPVGSRLLW